MHPLATIGYEATTVPCLVETLREERVDLLVDVRAVANSRRVGFSKKRLAGSLAEAEIDYLHLRGLGTPADGRAAARAGRHEELREIYLAHLETPAAQDDLETLAELVRSGRRVCLLCLEADPAHCHRTLVAAALSDIVPVEITHFAPATAPPRKTVWESEPRSATAHDVCSGSATAGDQMGSHTVSEAA